MSRLVPFNNRGRKSVAGNLFNMIDDFFTDSLLSENSPVLNNFRIDVQETENNYVIEAELPGFKKEEIDISLNEGHLTISVNRSESVDTKNDSDQYIHRERRATSMKRSMYLVDANDEEVGAKLEDGVLRVTVGKEKPASNARKINIE